VVVVVIVVVVKYNLRKVDAPSLSRLVLGAWTLHRDMALIPALMKPVAPSTIAEWTRMEAA
jgi:hypothetical protein